MSFPKAKLHRFNEEMTCAPPPGKYDPKFDIKVLGATMDKSKRFNEKKASSLSGSTESLDSLCTRYTPSKVFRTPQMPKKKIVTPRSAREMTNIQKRTTTTPGLKSKKKLNDIFMQEKENICEKTSEAFSLLDKDQEISLLNEVKELKKSMIKMENSSDILVNNLRSEFETNFNKLSAELEQSKSEIEKERESHQKSIDDFRCQIKILEENIKNSNAINSNLEEQLLEKQISYEEMSNKHDQIEEELKEAKDTINKLIGTHASEIVDLKKRYTEEIEGIATASELNLDLLTRTMEGRIKSLLKEIEMEREKSETDFEEKLNEIRETLKEKTKLIDSLVLDGLNKLLEMEEDIEKKSIEMADTLDFCSTSSENKLKEFIDICESLETQKVKNVEQKIIIVELEDKVDLLENEVCKLKKQGSKYEIIQNEAAKTIKVLSIRLFESESEVEKQNEIFKEMKNHISVLEEQIRTLVYENNQLTNNLSDLRNSIVVEVKEVESILLGKVDNYKKKATEEMLRYRNLLEEQQNHIESILSELDFYKNNAVENSEYINLCQNRITSYKEEIKELSLKFNELDDEQHEKLTAQKNLYNILNENYETLQMNYEMEKENFQKEIDSLSSTNLDLEEENNMNVEKINSLKISLQEANDQLDKSEKEMKVLEETIEGNKQNIESLVSKVDQYADRAKKSAQQIKSLTKANQDLNNELKNMEVISNEKDLKIESLSIELGESKNYVQSVTEHFVSLMNELAEKDRKCEMIANELEIKNVNMIQVSEEYEKIKKLHENETERVKNIEKDLKDTQSDNEKYVDELISELVLEKERCTELSLNIEEVKQKNNYLEKKIQDLEIKLEISEDLEVYKKQVRFLEGNIEELKIENTDINNEIEALYREVEESEREVEELKTEKKKTAKIINEMKAEKGDLMEMIKQQQEEMELLTNEISCQQETIDELKQTKNDTFEEIKSEIRIEMENEFLILQQHLEEKQKIVTQLQAKEQDLIYKLKAAEADLIAAETEKKNAKDKINDISEKNIDLTNNLTAMEKRKNEYKLYAVEIEQDFKMIKEQLAVLTDEKENLKEQCHEDSMKNASVAATIADLECRNRELESIIGPFKDLLLKYESERTILLKKSETTEKELRALEIEHAKALGHHNHKQKIKHVVHLTEQITELKTELDKLRTENTKLRASILETQKEMSLRIKRRDKENDTTSPMKLTKPRASSQSSPALKERTNAN